ncbi:DinB family protein [Paenibacillus xylanilyticus]|uniref:DinB family protein n=1 Tax=Paenibacillus xylanilyticus TaxID=248903 RepID=A0A7Y6C1M3_9BACL|nr:DinB family protein [Paenibacillus xylanilyticus]NUU78846.1 DinB family protein [Paenibacillus xylanilyticus]
MNTMATDLLLIQKDDTWDQCNWIVPLAKALEGLTAEQAAWIPPSGGLSIWQLVNHMYYYNNRLLYRIQGTTPSQPAADDNVSTFGDSGDPLNTDGWNQVIQDTHSVSAELRAQIASLQQSDLEAPYMNTEEKLGHELARWVLHDAYHAGQIVLLRRQQGSWNIVF